MTQTSYRLRPASAISERRYLLTLGGVVLASIALIMATGGALGPFVYLAYLAVFAGTVIIRPFWSIVAAAMYVAYLLGELAWHATGHVSDHADRHVAE